MRFDDIAHNDCGYEKIKEYLKYNPFSYNLFRYYFNRVDIISCFIRDKYCFDYDYYEFLLDKEHYRELLIESSDSSNVFSLARGLLGLGYVDRRVFDKRVFTLDEWRTIFDGIAYNYEIAEEVVCVYKERFGDNNLQELLDASLETACWDDRLESVKVFIGLGADIHRNDDGVYRSIRSYMRNRVGYMDVLGFLEENGCSNLSPLEKEYLNRVTEEV